MLQVALFYVFVGQTIAIFDVADTPVREMVVSSAPEENREIVAQTFDRNRAWAALFFAAILVSWAFLWPVHLWRTSRSEDAP